MASPSSCTETLPLERWGLNARPGLQMRITRCFGARRQSDKQKEQKAKTQAVEPIPFTAVDNASIRSVRSAERIDKWRKYMYVEINNKLFF
jgi:hypothetical protein